MLHTRIIAAALLLFTATACGSSRVDDADIPSCTDSIAPSCGDTLGLDKQSIYHCEEGVWTVSDVCEYGCESRENNEGAQCSCPSGNGLYCGKTVGMDVGSLYNCLAGALSLDTVCQYGCESNRGGFSDACYENSQDTCPTNDGYYCGTTLGKEVDTLYWCQKGTHTFSSWCSAGCQIAAAGFADSCNEGQCPSGNGLYCGQHADLNNRTLYECQQGVWTVVTECNSTCVVAEPGLPDSCR